MKRVLALLFLFYGVAYADPTAPAGSSYRQIMDEGSGLTRREKLNLTGSGVTCVDNAGNLRTDCTITTGAGGASALEMFSNLDATRSSPTASIGAGVGLKTSVSGSTYTFRVDFSSVASRSDLLTTRGYDLEPATVTPRFNLGAQFSTVLLSTSDPNVGNAPYLFISSVSPPSYFGIVVSSRNILSPGTTSAIYLGAGSSPFAQINVAGNNSLYVSSEYVQIPYRHQIRFGDADNSNYAGFVAPSILSTNLVWRLPLSDSSGCLSSDGSGNLSITTCGSGGSGSSTLFVGTGTASNFTTLVTSPTAAISFLGSQFRSIADGTTNFISIDPSVLGSSTTASVAYGLIYTSSSSVQQTGISTTPAKLTIFTANGSGSGTTPSHSSDQITVSTTAAYYLYANVISSGSGVGTLYFQIRVNGSNTNITCQDSPSARCEMGGVYVLTAGDVVTLYGASSSGTQTINVLDAQLSVHTVGGSGAGGGGSGDITDVTAGYGISVANSTGPDPIVSLVTNSTSYIQNRTSAQSSATAFPTYLQVGSSATFHGENLFNTNSGDEVQKFFVRDAPDPSNYAYIPYLFRDQDGGDNYYADFSVTSSSVSDGGNTGWGEITWGIMNLGTIGNRLHLKGSASGVFLGLAGEMRYYDVTGFNNEYVALASSPTVPSSYKIVMPDAPGTVGQVRSIVNVDGSTVYEAYSTPAAGGGGSAITIATGSASGYSGAFTSAASGVVFDSTTFSGQSLAVGTSVYVYANAISTGTGRVKTSKMSFSYALQPFSAKVISPGATSYPKIDMATTSAVSSIFWDSTSTQTVSYATVLAPYSGGNFNIDFNFSGSSVTTGNVNWGAFVNCAGQGKATSVDSLFSSYSIQASTAGAIPGTAGYVYCLTIRGLSNNGCSEGDVLGVLVTRNHNVSSDAVGDIRLFSSRIYED